VTVEFDLFTLLRTFADHVFPDVAPHETPRPYVTYQQIGGAALSYVDDVVPAAKNGYFQINVWSNTRQATAALALQIEAAMIAATVFQARPMGAPVAEHEPDLAIYGSRQDFSIWSAR
jgi:hypothetical protein